MTRTEAEARDERLEVDRQRMPYTLDAGLAGRARIGLVVLASDHTIEHEFAHLLGLPGVGVYHSRIANDPEINAETLAAMEERLTAAADTLLPGVEFDVIAYGCTSASMVIGPERVHQRIRAARPGAVCTTPMEAALAALAALGVRRIAFVPPYVDAINRRMRRYFIDQGVAVPVMGSWNLASDNDVARLSPASVREAVLELGAHPSVDAVFVSCTSVRLAAQVESLERELGKPVTSSNHATAWHCLRLAGIDDILPGRGRLFELGTA